MAKKSTGALNYYAIYVNMRSALAEHGETCVGRFALICLYCAEQVNGGVIQDCGAWTSRQWMIRVGLEGRPEDIPGLYHWEGDHLVVDAYNQEAEEKALNLRRCGKHAAEARWGKKDENANGIPECNDLSNTESNAKRIPERNADSNADCITPGNAKERKGEERKVEGETTTVDSIPWEDVPPPPPVFSSPSRPRIADNHPSVDPRAWQFVAACLQVNPVWSKTMPTAQEQGVALEAWESCQGSVTPKDIRLLKAYYASDLDADRKGKPFWRPDSRSRFWEKFNDVLTHATRWAKETRWKPKTPQATKSKDEPTDVASEENSLSIEDALKALHDPNWNPDGNIADET